MFGNEDRNTLRRTRPVGVQGRAVLGLSHLGLHLGMVVGLLFGSVLGIAGCRSQEERAAHHLERGRDFLDSDDHTSAWIEFSSVLQLEADHLEANLELAQMSQAAGKISEATFYLQEAYAADPRSEAAVTALAVNLRESDPLHAREILVLAIADSPKNPIYHLALSQVEIVLNRFDSAIASAQTAMKLNPDIPGPYWQLAISYEAAIYKSLQTERFSDAEMVANGVDALSGFLERGGEPRWKALLEQSRILATHRPGMIKALVRAREALTDALATGEDYPKQSAAKNLAQLAQAMDNKAAYADALEVVLEFTPRDFLAWRNLAELRNASGGSAKAVLDTLIERLPDHPRAHIEYARYVGQRMGLQRTLQYYNEQIDRGMASDHLLFALREFQLTVKLPSQAALTQKRLEDEFPESPWTKLVHAKVAARQGKPRDARVLIEEVLALEAIPEGYELLATIEEYSQNLGAAMAAIRAAIDSYDGVNPTYLGRLASMLSSAKAHRELIDTLETVAGRKPLSQKQKLALAVAQYGVGARAEGQRILLELIEDPEMADVATLELARLESADPRHRQIARKHLQAAVRRNPNSKKYIVPLANIAIADERPAAALKLLNRLKLGRMNGEVLVVRAQLRAERGDVSGAISDAELALREDPASPPLIDLCLALYSISGETESAIEKTAALAATLRSQLNRDWLDTMRKIAWLNILHARLLQLDGRIDEAITVLTGGVQDLEFVIETKIELAYLLAWSGKQGKRAIEVAEAVVEKRPGDPRALDTLGFALLKMNRSGDALEQFQQASLAAREPSPLIRLHESMALQNMGRMAEALKAIDAVLAIDPEYPSARDRRESIKTNLGSGEASKAS